MRRKRELPNAWELREGFTPRSRETRESRTRTRGTFSKKMKPLAEAMQQWASHLPELACYIAEIKDVGLRFVIRPKPPRGAVLRETPLTTIQMDEFRRRCNELGQRHGLEVNFVRSKCPREGPYFAATLKEAAEEQVAA